MKYKVGDWVQLIDHRGRGWASGGAMDHYKGRVVQITRLSSRFFGFEGDDDWLFNIEQDIAGYAKNKIVSDILRDL